MGKVAIIDVHTPTNPEKEKQLSHEGPAKRPKTYSMHHIKLYETFKPRRRTAIDNDMSPLKRYRILLRGA